MNVPASVTTRASLADVAAAAGGLELTGAFAPCPDRRAAVVAVVAGADSDPSDAVHLETCERCATAAAALARDVGGTIDDAPPEDREVMTVAVERLEREGFFAPCPDRRSAVLEHAAGRRDAATLRHLSSCFACAAATDSLRAAAVPLQADARRVGRPRRPATTSIERPRIRVVLALAALVVAGASVVGVVLGSGSSERVDPVRSARPVDGRRADPAVQQSGREAITDARQHAKAAWALMAEQQARELAQARASERRAAARRAAARRAAQHRARRKAAARRRAAARHRAAAQRRASSQHRDRPTVSSAPSPAIAPPVTAPAPQPAAPAPQPNQGGGHPGGGWADEFSP